jgi:hypothetical protein
MATRGRVLILTADEYLFQKIRLELDGEFECIGTGTADVVLADIDTVDKIPAGALTMSRRGGGDIALPFKLGQLKERLMPKQISALTLGERCAMLDGKAIRLTDVEFALFKAIYSRGGRYVSREELLSEVWGGSADGGVINVYVHYLREKLEAGGERVILASRGEGYKINEKFLGGRR